MPAATEDRLGAIRSALPKEGLFAEKDWLLSPDAFPIDKDFERVPLGTYQPFSFWITAVLFASEHGSFWGVGLLAGVAYNWWMLRTRNLADCVLAHAVTNACLAGYVLFWGRWEYWG